MWENNRDVRHVFATAGTQQAWAILDGVSGWKRVRAGSPDGVSNVAQVLTTAKTRGRKVNAFIQNNQIERALML
jgi:hypothetical protein